MDRIVFHVGPHKTGTTYIQSLLHNNKDTLEFNGVCYPDVYYLHFGHHYLLNELQGNNSAEEVRKKITGAALNSSTCILSSENFIFLRDHGLKKLMLAFEEFDISFVLYLRRPSLRLLSRWHEEVKHGASEAFESYFFKQIVRPMKSREVNIFRYVDDLIKIFGRKAVRLVDYDTSAKDKSLMADFQKAADIGSLVSDVDTIVNRMTDLAEIEIIRYLNFNAREEKSLKGSNVREKFYELKGERGEFSDLVRELNLGISARKKEVVLGDAGFDFAIREKAVGFYKDLFVNKQSIPSGEMVGYPATEWAFDPRLQSLSKDISKILLNCL